MSDEKTLSKYAENLLSGAVFGWAAAGESSADMLSYHGPLRPMEYGDVLQRLGRIASESDRMAAAVAKIVSRINVYGSKPQLFAAIAVALGEILSAGYTDVIGAAGPEAGRPSQYQHQTNLRDAIRLAFILAEIRSALGDTLPIGWALRDLATENNVQVNAYHFPGVYAALSA